MKLWNKEYTKEELMKYIGDISQACGVRRSVLDDGPGRGMRVFEVNTGAGLTFSVLPDRGMDISHCSYNDIPLGFISKTGHVSPALCEYNGANGFLRGFTAGLLTTCGYTHMGASCNDEGIDLGLHGYSWMATAEHASSCGYWDGDDYIIKISGTTREARVFAENIQSTREIYIKAGENSIFIKDTVENCGFETQPLMMLYHVNFGYPLVSPDSILVFSKRAGVVPSNEIAEKELELCDEFQTPTHKYIEQVFYHDLVPGENGAVYAGIVNKNLNIGANVKFNKNELPYLIQWKQMGEGDYVCGIEPATWKPEGRDKARKLGELQFIEPGEKRKFNLEIAITKS